MRHAIFVEPGKVEWREAPDAKVQGAKEAVVRPVVVGRCDLDVAFLSGLLPMPAGSPIGHEIIGEVTDIGDGVGNARPGDLVFVTAQISCGECNKCRRGFTGRCESVPFGASYGMGREGGFGAGLADLVRVPFADAMLMPVPDGADPVKLIGAADMGTDAWRAVGEELGRNPKARVLVLGGMPPVIGLYSAGIAAAMHAPVFYVDADARRREVAESYGALSCANVGELPDGLLYDIIVVAQPTAAALTTAFELAAPAALVTSVTPAVDAKPTVDTATLYHKGLRWAIGRPDCRHCRDGVMHVWSSHGFAPDRVPTEVVSWDDAPAAWSSDALYVAAVRDGYQR